MMEIIYVDDYDSMSRCAADFVEEQIKQDKNTVLGLATGSTPLGLYGELGKRYREGRLSMQAVRGFNLDEYKGLPREHEQSFCYYLKKHLIDQTDFKPENLQVLNSMAEDIEIACSEYEEAIKKAGGIDLQILGLGMSGHIGFNEPADFFPKTAHCVRLEKETIESNARFFDRPKDVPEYALTMGIGTIMRARKLLMIVNGEKKADILREALYGEVRPQVPASILQFHPDCTVIVDAGAAQQIRKCI